MKIICSLLFSIVLGNYAYASLKCSGNGTSVLFINGAFTSFDEQTESKKAIS